MLISPVSVADVNCLSNCFFLFLFFSDVGYPVVKSGGRVEPC